MEHFCLKIPRTWQYILRRYGVDVREEDEEDEDVRRCEYVSEDGIQCRNQARPGSRFCGIHDTDAFDDAEDLI